MEREKLVENLGKITTKLEALNEMDEIFVYITRDKYIDGIGTIEEIESIPMLMKAQLAINKHFAVDEIAEANLLGLTEEEISLCDDDTIIFKGIQKNHWDADIRNKLSELRHYILIDKLTNAKNKLEGHLSADDRFAMDTDGIENILSQC